VTISRWLNFGRHAPPGKGSVAGRSFWLPLLVTASAQYLRRLWALFSLKFITQRVLSRHQRCYSTPCSNVQPATAYEVMEARWTDIRLRRLNIRYLCQSVCSMPIRQICRMYNHWLRQQKITGVNRVGMNETRSSADPDNGVYGSLFLRYSMSKNVVTLKSGSEATQGHWKLYHSVDRVWFPISVL